MVDITDSHGLAYEIAAAVPVPIPHASDAGSHSAPFSTRTETVSAMSGLEWTTPSCPTRAWFTDLDSDTTHTASEHPLGFIRSDGIWLDAYYPSEEQTDYLSEATYSVWLHYRHDYPFRFYVWASLIDDGRVVAIDYAPDVGWLDPLPQPDPRLVGPSWDLESLRTDGVTTAVPGGAGATLRFETDGDMEIDAPCGPDGDAATFRRRLTRTLDNRLRDDAPLRR